MACDTGFRRNQRGNTVAGLLVGLLIGCAIAAAVALYINFGHTPFKVEAPSVKTSQSAPVAAQSTPIVLPGKPGDQPVVKPKFDFYKILPGGEAASAPVADKSAEVEPDRIYLQAGAYQNPSDADNLKARLALMGIEATVQRVDLAAKGIFYRVRLGTFGSADAAESMRARLATDGIEATIVRSKP
jgi:cell division protein FtsN